MLHAQGTVQEEARRLVDRVQRLPSNLAAALPLLDVELLPGSTARDAQLARQQQWQQRQQQQQQLSGADRAWLAELVQGALQQAAADRNAAGQVLHVQSLSCPLGWLCTMLLAREVARAHRHLWLWGGERYE